MNLVTAMAIVIGLLSVLATWLFTGPVLGGLGLSLWAAFIAWASFFNQGGGEDGLMKSLLAALWGCITATLAFVLINSGALAGLGEWAVPVIVGLTVAILILGSMIPAFSSVPAAIYGYASCAAFALMGNHVGDALSMNISTMPLLNIFASMVIGGLFGYVSEKLIGALTKG